MTFTEKPASHENKTMSGTSTLFSRLTIELVWSVISEHKLQIHLQDSIFWGSVNIIFSEITDISKGTLGAGGREGGKWSYV